MSILSAAGGNVGMRDCLCAAASSECGDGCSAPPPLDCVGENVWLMWHLSANVKGRESEHELVLTEMEKIIFRIRYLDGPALKRADWLRRKARALRKRATHSLSLCEFWFRFSFSNGSRRRTVPCGGRNG